MQFGTGKLCMFGSAKYALKYLKFIRNISYFVSKQRVILVVHLVFPKYRQDFIKLHDVNNGILQRFYLINRSILGDKI
jgi:hypothetical protein